MMDELGERLENRWPALISGQIAAAGLTLPVSFKADAHGFSRLIDTTCPIETSD